MTRPLCHLQPIRAYVIVSPHVSFHPIVEMAAYCYHLRRYSEAGEHLLKRCAIGRVAGLLQIDEAQQQQYARFPSQLLQPAQREHHVAIRRCAVGAKPVLLLRQQFLGLAVGAEPRGDYLEEDLTRLCYE